VGEIKLYAGKPPAGVVLANGQVLAISSYAALFSVIGTTYGSDGTTDFAVPDLRGTEPKGSGHAGVSYYICTSGTYP
jgi:microcystin-dependent protein